MSDLFRRVYRVQVGTLNLSELACKFHIKRSLHGRAGTCELEVYNLADAHRREIASAPRRTTFVEVQAGYAGTGLSTLFRGDLRKAITVRESTAWVAKITAGDGEHALLTARVSRSFAANTTVETVVRHIADAMGVGIGNAVTAMRAASLRGASLAGEPATFPAGTMVHGSASAELARLCASVGTSFTIQDGALQVLPLGGSLQRTAVSLSPDSGMIGAPEIVNRRAIKLKCLIQPGLTPGQEVVVQSQVIDGTWRITECDINGETHGSAWDMSLACHRPAPPLISNVTVETGVQ